MNDLLVMTDLEQLIPVYTNREEIPSAVAA
jgi:hypothetical protein